MMYLILCWNLHTVFSQCSMYSEHIANAGSLPLLEGLALSQLPGILSKSFQVIALGGEHLGSARGECQNEEGEDGKRRGKRLSGEEGEMEWGQKKREIEVGKEREKGERRKKILK